MKAVDQKFFIKPVYKNTGEAVKFKPQFSKNLNSFKKKIWIDNSISNPNCKKLYDRLRVKMNLLHRWTFRNKRLKRLKITNNIMFSKKFNFFNINNILKKSNFLTIKKIKFLENVQSWPNKKYSRNSTIVALEFYQLWFYRTLFKNILNKRNSFFKTVEGQASALWKTFRRARYDFEAKKLRNLLKLNWTDALYYKTIGNLGPHYLKPIKNIHFKALLRLKKAKIYFRRGMNVFKEGLRRRMMFGINFATSKKHMIPRRNWKFSKKLSRLYCLSAKFNLLQYKYLKKQYLKHAARYNFIAQGKRLTSYFNILTSFNNTQLLNRTSSWIRYFNLTKRRPPNPFMLWKKRLWSAQHNINLKEKKSELTTSEINLLGRVDNKPEILDIFDCKEHVVLLNRPKPVISYKGFNKNKVNIYFKSRLGNKSFIKTESAKYAICRLSRKLRKIKFNLYKKYKFDFSKFLSSTLKNLNIKKKFLFNFIPTFKYTRNESVFLKLPSVLYPAPLHLRHFKNSNYYAVVISITQKNYFFTLISANKGEVKKVFSSGYSGGKTTRLRRSAVMFNKVFNQFIDYLKSRNINKLRFVRITQPGLVPKNISFEDQKKLSWYPNQFKHSHIRVRRWIYELKRVHGLPLRGPKLRRK